MVERYSHLARAGFIKCGGGEYVRFSAYATLEEKLDEALKALDEIASNDEPADVEGLVYLAREAANRIRERLVVGPNEAREADLLDFVEGIEDPVLRRFAEDKLSRALEGV